MSWRAGREEKKKKRQKGGRAELPGEEPGESGTGKVPCRGGGPDLGENQRYSTRDRQRLTVRPVEGGRRHG